MHFLQKRKTASQRKPIASIKAEQQCRTHFSNCEGASIYIDGVKQENIITDADGKVTLPALEARETPYFITAEKLIDNDGAKVTAISAAYANVTVVPDDGDSGDYINSVELSITKMEVRSIRKQSILLMEASFLHFQVDQVMETFMQV